MVLKHISMILSRHKLNCEEPAFDHAAQIWLCTKAQTVAMQKSLPAEEIRCVFDDI